VNVPVAVNEKKVGTPEMRVEVDLVKCVGAGQCVALAPEVFDQQDDGIVLLLEEHPAPELHEQVHEAALVCPGVAIRLHERAE